MSGVAKTSVRQLHTRTLVLHYEIMIDGTVNEVWPELFNYNTWNPQHIGAEVQRIAGERSRKGELILESKKSGDGYLPPILIETVEVIAFRKLVWKMYKPEESPEITFVDFTLEAMGERTRFTYNSYGEILEERFRALPGEETYRHMLAEIFTALKRHVEGRN
jgi:hypothetical protein